MLRGLAAFGTALAASVGLALLLSEPGPDLSALKTQYQRPAENLTPAARAVNAAELELGKALFYDPRLSSSNSLSCASCHNPALGWEDGRARGVGEAGSPLARHTPTLWNLAWEETFFWDGRAASLEEQARGPIESPLEMNQSMEALEAELAAVAGYRELFAAAFPERPEIDAAHISAALASFQRTLVSPRTPFDRWIEGDGAAIGAAAKRGFMLFNGKARCAECHSGWAFTDRAFHDIGLPDADLGRGPVIGLAEINHGFKTPTLRDLGRRAPYMHDGSLATLEDVIEHYDSGFTERPTLAEEMQPLELSAQEKADLIAFLRTLDSQETIPQALAPELPQ
jgi:cytochrome c peroxidase